MSAVGVYDQIEKAFQDIVAPELHALRGDIRVLDQRIVGLDQRIVGLDQKIDGVDQRLSEKIDGVDARLATKIDGLRSETVSMKAELLAEIRRRSEEHTSELQSHHDLVCRLLLEKKKKN